MTLREIFISASFALCGCGATDGRQVVLEGFAEGTTYRIVIVIPRAGDATGLQRQVDSLFAAVESSMSIYDSASLISRLNDNRTDSLDGLITYCIRLANRVSEESGGLYDVTIMPLTRAWGFGSSSGSGSGAGVGEGAPNIDSLLQFVGYQKLSIENGRLRKADPRMAVDLNSVAKGYSSDLLGMLLEQLGYKNFMVEVGGEIVARGRNAGRQPWRVGVDKPIEDNILPGGVLDTVIMLTDKALATSGNYRNYHLGADGRRIVHTINPLTGLSEPTDMLSATVVADRCAIADAYATMFMAMGSVRAIAFARERREVRVYFIYTGSDGKIQRFTNL